MSDQWGSGQSGQGDGWGNPPDQGGGQWGQPPDQGGGQWGQQPSPDPWGGGGAPGGYGQPGYGQGGYGQPGFQPPTGGYGPSGKPSNHMVPAILTTLLCCLPLGVVSIVFAAKVDNQWNSGDYQGAIESSNKAKQFWQISIGVAAIGIVLYILFVFLAVGGAFVSGI